MDNKLIISIGRQVGSGGLTIARKLSESYGIKLYDKELLSEAAKRSGLNPAVFETNDEKGSRHLKTILSFRSLIGGGSNTIANSVMTDEDTFKVQSDIMRKVASEESCVFVGRCADYILRDNPGLFSVFITAPLEDRIHRIMENSGIDEAAARKLIEKTEKSRSDYYNYYTFKKWGDSSSYDLCVDSSKLGIEGTIEIIKTAIDKWQTKK